MSYLECIYSEKFKVTFFSVAILDVLKCLCIAVCSVNLVTQRYSIFNVNEKQHSPSSALNFLTPAHTEIVFYFIFCFYLIFFHNTNP